MRLVPLRLNYEGTVGYLAFWARGLRAMYNVACEERPEAEYETYTDTKGVWIYYPMDRNEYIIKVCKRPFSEGSFSSTLLVCHLEPNFLFLGKIRSDRFISLSRTARGF